MFYVFFVIIVRFILCFVRNKIFLMFLGVWGLFCFFVFGVDWKGRVPALTERGLFGFGFCVPSDIALEKRSRSGSDGSWPFLNRSYSCIEEFRSISETFEKKCLGFVVAWEKATFRQ